MRFLMILTVYRAKQKNLKTFFLCVCITLCLSLARHIYDQQEVYK
jgi:hypothetical protein